MKLNYSKIHFGKYYELTGLIHNYWRENYIGTDYLLSAEEAYEALKKYGTLEFYPEEKKEFKLF